LSAVVDDANATDRKIKPLVMVKVSPDEDSDSQIRGICDAVWESGVAGVIVGNTTMGRPDPLPAGYVLPEKEAQAVLETGGYSGPQLFDQTKKLVHKYRKALDDGPSEDTPLPSRSPAATPPQLTEPPSTADAKAVQQVEASTARNVTNLKPTDEESASSEHQPLIQLPERHSSSPSPESATPPLSITTLSASSSIVPFTGDSSGNNETPQESGKSKALNSAPKVIFASGGITNGGQALEVLNAGASVAMCYTAVVYGGVGTVSRMKAEMRDKITTSGNK
jgi:dihydroorotate dehydrogenase